MGSRGSFVNVEKGDFSFVEDGKKYESMGEIAGVKIIQKMDGPVNAPAYSHSPNRIYAVLQKGNIKYLAFYDENHKQVKIIDFFHFHGTNHIKPHIHYNMIHDPNEPGTPPTEEDWKLIEEIQKGIKKKS